MHVRYIAGSSAAYDLDRFQTKPKMKIRKPVRLVNPSKKARAKAQLAMAVKVMAALAMLVTVVVVMLYSNAMITELNQQISAQQKSLEQLVSEQTRLQAELESKVSLRNVEDYASQTLGFAPMDKSRVTYVDLGGGDKIELTSESPKQTIVGRVEIAINNVKSVLAKD